MKPLKTAGILAAVLLALGGLATWDEWKTKKDESIKEGQNRLVQFDMGSITRFEFDNAGNELKDGETAIPEKLSLKAQKIDDAWKITAPIETKGDLKAIENLLSTLKDYKYEKVMSENPSDLAKFGLESPRRRLAIFSGDKLLSSILIGSNSPIGYHVYSTAEHQSKIYIGSQYLAVATNKTLFDLRDKTLVKVDLDKLKSFTLRSFSSNPFTVQKNEAKFVIAGTEAIDADSQAVKIFFEDLERVTVQEVIDSPSVDLASSMARATEASLTWNLVDGTSHKFSATELGINVFVRMDNLPVVYRLAPEFKAKFSQQAPDFRNRRIFQFTSADISNVEINGKLFKKIGDDWFDSIAAGSFSEAGTYIGPADMKPQGDVKVRSLIVDLEFARAIDFLVNDDLSKRITATAPTHQIKLTFGKPGESPPLIVDLWPDTSSGEKVGPAGVKTWFLRHSKNPGLIRVGKSLVETLLTGAKDSIPGDRPMPSAINGRSEGLDMEMPDALDDSGKKNVSGISN